MKTQGYIHLHRSLLSWPYHNNPSMLTVWTHLLMLAEYEDCQYDGITVHRGELLISQQWFSEFVGISLAQLRLCLSFLEKTGLIAKRKAGKITALKILQYDDYQGNNNAKQPTDSSVNSSMKSSVNSSIGRNINNKKNLSDGEIQKTPTTTVETKASMASMASMASKASMASGTAGKPGTASASNRSDFTRQLVAAPFWKQKCCADYRIDPSLIDRHILAFHECLLREQPNKTWLSFEDFCRHFHSWLRFQTPESIRRYCGFAVKRRQQQVARKVEEERQQQMWKEIEETKSRAVSYEEYLKNKHDPLTPQGGTFNSFRVGGNM